MLSASDAEDKQIKPKCCLERGVKAQSVRTKSDEGIINMAAFVYYLSDLMYVF